MKKYLKIFSALLVVVCIITCTVVTSSALPGYNVDSSEPELSYLSWKAHSYLVSYSTPFFFTGENTTNIATYFDEAQQFILLPEKFKSDEVRQDIISNLSAELNDKLAVSQLAIDYLYESVKDESNDNNYYSEELWNNFIKARDALAAEIDNLTFDKHSNTLFFNLRNAVRDLCLSNDVMGDVNKDGKTNIMDMTYMQKSFAKITPSLNMSQRFISAKWSFTNDFSIADVTNWQKEFAGLTAVRDNSNYTFVLESELEFIDACDKMNYYLCEYNIPVETEN